MNETIYTKSKRSVCSCEVTPENFEMNKEVYLPVCNICKGTEREQRVVEELQDSLADGLVCGCI